MKTKLMLLIAMMALFLGACSSAAPAWKTLTSQAGSFSIDAPGDFKESTQSTPAGPVNVDLHMFTLTQGSAAFFIAYADFPADLIKSVNANDALEGGVQGAMSSTGATLVDKSDITLDGNPGKEFTGDIPAGKSFSSGGIFKARAYLVGPRLYQMFIAAPKGDNAVKDADKYLTSFKLLSGKPPAVASASESAPSSSVPSVSASSSKSSVASPASSAVASSVAKSSSSSSNSTVASAKKYDTVFPLPATVENFTGGGGENQINFQTTLSLNDVMQFYRDAFAKQGLTEWTEATRNTNDTFNLVFRGAANGMAIVVQGVAMGNKTNVNIRYEKI